MKNVAKGSIFGKIILFIVGLMLILIASINILLFIFGDTSTANISTRRVGGSNDSYPAESRYEWSVDYDFLASDGNVYNGTTTRRGSDMGVKVENMVYYFSFQHRLNSLSSEVRPNAGQIIMMLLGGFLLSVAFKKSNYS